MKKKLRTLIHIGQHKTATTSIQHYLKDNRIKLAKEGLYVPDSLAGYDNPSHFLLNVYALNKNRFSSMKEELVATKSSKFFDKLKQNLEKDINRHYDNAKRIGDNDLIWSNEGLYLLNSAEEYQRLIELFEQYSSEVVCICCFRDYETYRISYIEELNKQGLGPSDDRDSYRYVKDDSWIFDYEQKKQILRQVFDKTIFFSYSSENMVKNFMEQIGYTVTNGDSIKLNITARTK